MRRPIHRPIRALGLVAAVLLAASAAGAHETGPPRYETRATIGPVELEPTLEYRAHPRPRRGFDRVRRAVPPRVNVDHRSGRDRDLPYGVWVTPRIVP